MRFKNKIVWITGASSGIGESLVYGLDKEGAQVILSARSVDKLKEIQTHLTNPSYLIPFDLTDSQQIEAAVNQVKNEIGRVDVLLNNGGRSTRFLAMDTPIDYDRQIMEVDYFGHIMLTKLVLPMMLKQGQGHIVVNSSVVGKFGFKLRSAYAAAKHALHGFFESLRFEMIEHNISVTIVNPGRIQTNISISALTKDGTVHGKMDRGQKEGMPLSIFTPKLIKAIYKKKREVTIGGKETLLVYFKRYFPALFYLIAKNASPT